MPGLHKTWHVLTCSSPFNRARHSKQTPMPHTGQRASPATDFRYAPAIINAAAAVQPALTDIPRPLTITLNRSDMRVLQSMTRRQEWIGPERERSTGHHRGNQFTGGKRSRDAQSFMTRGQQNIVGPMWSD